MLSPWDVVVVPFPYTERLAEKRRPALVISSKALGEHGYIWLAMITGAAKQRLAGDVLVTDIGEAGLPGPSMVRTAKVATAEPGRILKRVGALAMGQRDEIRRAIERFLAG